MTAPLQRNHQDLTELELMEPGAENQYLLNRAKNFPNSLLQTHPHALDDINLHTTPISYLQNLYPQIWHRGPRGEHLDNQLRTLQHVLDTHTYSHRFDQFIDTLHNSDITNLTNTLPANLTATKKLFLTAYTQGLPLPGDAIYHGIDYNTDYYTSQPGDQPGNPLLNQLRYHPAWDDNPANFNAFENFLYNFALISVHINTFNALADTTPHLNAALRDYHTFCTTWGIPR